MTQMTPELLAYFNSTLLEGPCWSEERHELLVVSIEQSCIYLINPQSQHIQSIPTHGPVGCAVFVEKNKIWSAEKGGIYETNLTSMERTFLVHPESRGYMRYNDGKLDPQGRFIFGSMGFNSIQPNEGKVFSFDGESCKTIIEGTTISNGLAWNSKGDTLYFIDTPTRSVRKYNYDCASGKATFLKTIISFDGIGLPDGMCIDQQDNLWIAEWEGGQVCKWDPNTGEKLETIKVPCNRVTSCCMAPPDRLFITTARSDHSHNPLGGALFLQKLNSK